MLSDKIKYNKDEVGRVSSVQIPIEIWDDLIDNYEIPTGHISSLDKIQKNIDNGNEKIYSEEEVNLDKL